MIRLVKQAFEQAHWPTQVSTGRFAFPLEEGSHAANNEDRLEDRLLMLQPQGLSDEL